MPGANSTRVARTPGCCSCCFHHMRWRWICHRIRRRRPRPVGVRWRRWVLADYVLERDLLTHCARRHRPRRRIAPYQPDDASVTSHDPAAIYYRLRPNPAWICSPSPNRNTSDIHCGDRVRGKWPDFSVGSFSATPALLLYGLQMCSDSRKCATLSPQPVSGVE